MPPAIVIDTNVLISGLRSAGGASYQLLRRTGSSEFGLSVAVPLNLEYEAVAKEHARDLGLTFGDIDDLLDYICSVADPRTIFYLWRPFLRDPRDDLVLELAVEANADCIVTHNRRDFVGAEQFGVKIVSPGAFLQQLGVAL